MARIALVALWLACSPVHVIARQDDTAAAAAARVAPASVAQHAEPAPVAQHVALAPAAPRVVAAPGAQHAEAAPAAQEAAEYVPYIFPASDEAAAHLAQLRAADGLSISLWAAEPLLANPVCLALGDDGAVYVAESFRVHAGVTDIREHMDWLDDDLASETVADRLAMYAKWLGPDLPSYAREHDRVRRLTDTDGDGRADVATVFADGFSHAEDGIGSGLLAHRTADGATEVFYTNIPDLWRLTDADGDGRAESRESMSNGWGVRVAFMGHDMHGLRIGPDGRLYWSIGDRGFHVTTADGRLLHHPNTGAVLRCELDGSDLTVVHLGLRNPQELAFDDRGDLFTGDNNCDAGDLARFVPIVEGGDSGWRQPGQWLSDRGPWGREKLWAPRFDGQAAWIIPPIANIASGPSGLTHEPGTALSAFRDHFLLCDFTGGADSSRILGFPVLADGAFYKLGEVRDVLAGVLATDADFGPDGALSVSDWVEGWSGASKGRVWRLVDDALRDDPLRLQTAALLAAGPGGREVGELEALLGHADQRVRQAAQFELVTRGVPGLDALERAARRGKGLARLHGVWGLGIAARREARESQRNALRLALHGDSPERDPRLANAIVQRLAGLDQDADSEVRAQFFTVLEAPLPTALTDSRVPPPWPSWIDDALARGLADAEPRVVARAALAAGRVGRSDPFAESSTDPESRWTSSPHRHLAADVWEAARRADPTDPLLRHALAMALASLELPSDLALQVPGEARPLQLLRVLALRQQHSKLLATFLVSDDARVAAEAARAIHDLPVPDALPALAGLIHSLPAAGDDAGLPAARDGGPAGHDDVDVLVRRALNANARLGGPEQARELARFAARDDQRDAHRAFALEILAGWPQTESRDRIHGFHQAVTDRAPAPLADIARQLHDAGLGAAEAPLALTSGWIALCATAGAMGAAPDLAEPLAALLDDETRDIDLRVEALHALAAMNAPDLPAIVDRTLSAHDSVLRAEALVALEALAPDQALPRLPALLATGERQERRTALQILGRTSPQAGAAGAGRPGTGDNPTSIAATSAAASDTGPAAVIDPNALLAEQLDRALAGLHPVELQLDLVLAAEARHDPVLDARLAKLAAPRAVDPELAPFLDGLFGGDRDAGRRVFESASLSCQKCHATDEWGRQAVGPNLQGIGKRLAREQLLESIVQPDRRIAPGFDAELIFLRNGETLAGRVTSAQDGQLSVQLHDATQRWVPEADVELRKPGLSAMPEGLAATITREQMRDLIEYLAGT